ncbi:hypothetical protein BDZ97DRAFT_1819087 [Flammula alnicola]|nr:hypothetical protein BDZ97DRAFT_1819087 [Flammula alnicola]
MATNTSPINYAKAFGLHSETAAIVFAILYTPLFGWYIRQSFARPTFVHFILVLFCAIRLTAFAMRAALISLDSAGQNLNILIADEVLFGVGFFSLLYSAYTLVLDLEIMSDRPESNNPIIRLTKNRFLFRLTLTAAVALGIVAISSKTNPPSKTDQILHKVSTIIFLALTILQAFQTLLLTRMEIEARGQEKHYNKPFGARHAMAILFLVSILLLVREAFVTATVNNSAKQNNEHFWYPLLAIPEILVALLFGTPGLVPRRDELQQRQPQQHGILNYV